MDFVEILFNALGVLGGILLLFGFYRTNSGRWTNKSLWYELDNLAGAVLLIIYTIYYHAYISAILNVVWGGVAVMGLMVFFKRLHGHRNRRRDQK